MWCGSSGWGWTSHCEYPGRFPVKLEISPTARAAEPARPARFAAAPFPASLFCSLRVSPGRIRYGGGRYSLITMSRKGARARALPRQNPRAAVRTRMKEQLAKIRAEALAAFGGAKTTAELDALRVKYLGKKGELTAVLKQMGRLPPEERPVMGQLANEVRSALEAAIDAASDRLAREALERKLESEVVDVTVPGKAVPLGRRHPMYTALDEIKEIFIGMGFTVLDGPEVELAELNFDRLNAGEGHPSRDWSDTFYFDSDSRVMLRSQTSPMQVRAMDSMPLPIRIIAPGRVYRKDEVDATHSPMFHQVEGMVIDRGVTMADLKGTLNTVVEQLYGKGTKTRFRPHHFPFTEPSCEMDVQCYKCGGAGCPTCKGEGWIELLGAGMIHPKVLKMAGIDPDVYSGWAFGIGLERTAMRRFKIADMRLIFENDVRFLEQF